MGYIISLASECPPWVETGQCGSSWNDSVRWGAPAAMGEDSHKLRSLARQSRALAKTVSDRQRSAALEALASLYERQATEMEVLELSQF